LDADHPVLSCQVFVGSDAGVWKRGCAQFSGRCRLIKAYLQQTCSAWFQKPWSRAYQAPYVHEAILSTIQGNLRLPRELNLSRAAPLWKVCLPDIWKVGDDDVHRPWKRRCEVARQERDSFRNAMTSRVLGSDVQSIGRYVTGLNGDIRAVYRKANGYGSRPGPDVCNQFATVLPLLQQV